MKVYLGLEEETCQVDGGGVRKGHGRHRVWPPEDAEAENRGGRLRGCVSQGQGPGVRGDGKQHPERRPER